MARDEDETLRSLFRVEKETGPGNRTEPSQEGMEKRLGYLSDLGGTGRGGVNSALSRQIFGTQY